MSTYFSAFPLVRYNDELHVNLTRRVGISGQFKNDPTYFIEYSIQDSDTPEVIADKIYDDSTLAWIVLSMNDIINVFEEWPLTQPSLESYIKQKYTNPNSIKHYVSASNGMIVDPTANPSWDNVPVTFYEYELEQNESKRNIKLLMPDFVGDVVAKHKELMKVV